MLIANLTSSALLEGDLIVRIEEKAGRYGSMSLFTVERPDDAKLIGAVETFKAAFL